jgi:lipid II:glycine glycyltransferase (peptidoglycan interpeptide bridge formation enzyme)
VYSIQEATYPKWQKHIQNCQKTNMLQFWQYGDAKAKSSRWRANRFLIIDEDTNIIGFAQILSLEVPLIGGIARMNRGPMLISGYENSQELVKVFSALFEEFKKRRWFLIQIAPEINNSELVNHFLMELGLKKLSINPYASGLLNLLPSEQQLLMGLKKKWRYSLRKAKSFNIVVSNVESNKENIEILLNRYNELKDENEFVGISDSLVSFLSKQKKTKEWQFNIFIANTDNSVSIEKCCGILVSIRHGDTATYFIGISGEVGRELQVNYLLLWESILHAKDNGCDWFDIGGLDASTPNGIAHFKNGLKPEKYYLSGEWRGFVFPWKSKTNSLKRLLDKNAVFK